MKVTKRKHLGKRRSWQYGRYGDRLKIKPWNDVLTLSLWRYQKAVA